MIKQCNYVAPNFHDEGLQNALKDAQIKYLTMRLDYYKDQLRSLHETLLTGEECYITDASTHETVYFQKTKTSKK